MRANVIVIVFAGTVGRRMAQWLRRLSANREIQGSIPGMVGGEFFFRNLAPSDRVRRRGFSPGTPASSPSSLA